MSSWTLEGIRVTPSDLGVDAGLPVADATAVVTPDLQIRLYVFAQDQGIRSLVSDDGLNFTAEDGIRIEDGFGFPMAYGSESGAVDILVNSFDGIHAATSSDGLTFTIGDETLLSTEQAGFTPQSLSYLQLADGSYRGYFSDFPIPGEGPSDHQVYSAVSDDLVNWTVEDGVRIGPETTVGTSAEAPNALIDPNGKVYVFYCDNAVESSGSGAGIRLTTSSDNGRTFTSSDLLGIDGCDPAPIINPDGSIRLYYGNFNDSVGGYIESALWSEMWGSNQNDTLVAVLGDDMQLRGFGGDDYMAGWTGNDFLHGQSGADSIFGDDGDDTLRGGQSDDFLTGEAGADTLLGDIGSDVLYGGDGDDWINGGRYASYDGDDNDEIDGGAGADFLQGNLGNDTIYGDADNDTLRGGGGNDTLLGDDGDDLLYGDKGSDWLTGGAGTDRAVFQGLEADYSIEDQGGGSYLVTHLEGTYGQNLIEEIEFLQFDDGTLTL